MAAEALSRFFGEVIVLDKDTLPTEAAARMGTPQSFHAHALLVQGRRNLERLFPGFTSELIDRGVVCSRSGLEFRIHDAGGWQPRRDIRLSALTMSRALLENTVRDLLKRNPRVTIREETRVEDWAFDGDRLTGVVVAGDDGTETITTEFRRRRRRGLANESSVWLQAAEASGPVEETDARDQRQLCLEPSSKSRKAGSPGPRQRRHPAAPIPICKGGFMFSVENNCWSSPA